MNHRERSRTITTSKSFVLLVSLITSGWWLCATSYELDYEELKVRGFPYGEEVEVPDGGVVGIHLGTTYSSVAVFKHPLVKRICHSRREIGGRCVPLSNSDIIQVVPNELGSSTTPSCVAFTNDSRVLVGELAKAHSAIDPPRTICGATRLLGKRFDDPDVQVYIKTLPYKVVNKWNMPHIQVEINNGETRVFRPEEICAMILGKMKEIAEAYTGNEIEHAVVLFHQRNPMYANDDYALPRRSIKEASKMAGLNVVRVGNGRVHVAKLARREWLQQDWRVLVYYLGGAAFSATLLDQPLARLRDDRHGAVFGLVASRQDEHLGGQTFDTRVVDYFVDLIKRKHDKDISRDLNALGKLRLECEKAKITLSSSNRAMIKIESLTDGIELFEEPLTREAFEGLNMDLFNRTMDLVADVMYHGWTDNPIVLNEIVLVGGNARIPRIQHMLKEMLGREPLNDVNPDEALAFAATHMTNFNNYDRRFDVSVQNSMSVGIETVGGVMIQYVSCFDSLPITVTRYATTYRDGQTTAEIKVFEGLRALSKDCHYLGTLEIADLPPAPKGVVVIKVQVEVSLNSNVRVTATRVGSHKIKSMTVPFEERWYNNTGLNISQEFNNAWDFHDQCELDVMRAKEALRRLNPQEADLITKFSVVAL